MGRLLPWLLLRLIWLALFRGLLTATGWRRLLTLRLLTLQLSRLLLNLRFCCRVIEPEIESIGRELTTEAGTVECDMIVMVHESDTVQSAVGIVAQRKVDILFLGIGV